MRMSTPGTTILKARRTNTYETRPLILRALPGATTMLRRAWGMIKRDGRPGHSTSGTLFMPQFPRRPLSGNPAGRYYAQYIEEVDYLFSGCSLGARRLRR